MPQDDTPDSQDFARRHAERSSARRSNPVSNDKRMPPRQRGFFSESDYASDDRMAERMGQASGRASSGSDRAQMRMGQPSRIKNDDHHEASRQDAERRAPRRQGNQGVLGSILGNDPTTRKLMGGALAVVLVLLLIVGVWMALGGRHQGIPVIGPPPLPLKDRPTDPGGMQIMSDDTAITDVSGKGAVHLAPQPEQPDAGILARRGQDQEPQSQSNQESQGPAALSSGTGVEESAREDVTTVGGTVVAKEGMSKMQEGEERQALAPPPSDPVTQQDINTENPDTRNTPANSPDPNRSDSGKKSLTSSDIPASTLRDNVEKAARRSGRYEVQLAALDSEARARKQWTSLKSKASDLLGQKTPSYSKTERNGRSFVRVRIGGFADLSEARSFCTKLHARSIPCTPAAF